MVWAALVYAGIGSLMTFVVGRPIMAANVGQNAAEADYRYALVRLRENSEGVALFRDELVGSTLISIAHRPGLDAFHDPTLSLIKSATGARVVTKRRRSTGGSPPRRRILPMKLAASLANPLARRSSA